MISFKQITFISLAVSVLLACEDVPDFEPDQSVPVVEAFLYEGAAVEDITISEVIPFDSASFDSSISDLEIEIFWNGNTFFLEESAENNGKYFYPGDDLPILKGETYEMFFTYNNQPITASTTVPEAPFNLNLSTNIVELPQILDFSDLISLGESDNIQINLDWDSESENYFFVVIIIF